MPLNVGEVVRGWTDDEKYAHLIESIDQWLQTNRVKLDLEFGKSVYYTITAEILPIAERVIAAYRACGWEVWLHNRLKGTLWHRGIMFRVPKREPVTRAS